MRSTASQAISENTLNIALRRMGFGADEITAHGFRATASTIINETKLFSADAIEVAHMLAAFQPGDGTGWRISAHAKPGTPSANSNLRGRGPCWNWRNWDG